MPLLSLLALLPTLALAQTAAEVCTPCPQGTTEVGVSFQSAGHRHDFGPDLSSMGWNAIYRPPAHITTHEPLVVIGSVNEFRAEIIRLAGDCKRIGYMHLYGHGAPGRFNFDGSGQNDLSVGTRQALDGLSCAMAPNARIEMTSCSTAGGCLGEDLLRVLAAKFLRDGGGTVSGFTVWLEPMTWLRSPRDTITQTLTVGPGLTEPTWLHRPENVDTCNAPLVDDLSYYSCIDERWGEFEPLFAARSRRGTDYLHTRLLQNIEALRTTVAARPTAMSEEESLRETYFNAAASAFTLQLSSYSEHRLFQEVECHTERAITGSGAGFIE